MKTLIDSFVQIIGSQNVLSTDDLKSKYVHIWKMNDGLDALAYLTPHTTLEISEICKLCSEHHQPIIVYGGLTNLVGSTETRGDEVIISMEKMNVIEEVDTTNRSITVQAGVILENAQIKAKDNDLLLPLNFGAKGSAQIGGIISTNAGGLRVLRYGMTRNLVLGLEAVQMDGTIISSMKKITKDNSAYDIKQLFIGSEGTLGIITRAVLKLTELPKSRNSAFVAFNSFEKVCDFLKYIDKGLAGSLSGFELMWDSFYECITADGNKCKPVLPHGFKYYVLIESMGADIDKDHQAMEDLLTTAMEKEMILDGVMANTASDLEWFWNIREDVSVINAACTIDQHFDVSAPIKAMGEYVDKVNIALNKIDGVNAVYTFGHIADGNIHFIVDKENDTIDLKNTINDIVYGPLTQLGGSVSAEHGIGLHKKAYLMLCRSTAEIELMKTLKRTMDPKNLLNPGKVLDI